MKSRSIPFPYSTSGFTLIEVLVAAAVSMLLVGLLLSAANAISTNYSRTQAAITRQGDSSIALDQIVQDLEGVVIPNFPGAEGLRIEKITSVPQVTDAIWLAMVSTATDRDNSFGNPNPVSGTGSAPSFTGARRAISYRVVFQNPINPARDSGKIYALYRSVASARHTFNHLGPDKPNILDQYWKNIPPSPNPTPPPAEDPAAFLAGNVVNFQVRFEYLDSSGKSAWTKPGDAIRISRDGTYVNNQPIAGGFRRAEVSVTTLSPEGAQRVQDGALTLEEALARYGTTTTRQTSRL